MDTANTFDTSDKVSSNEASLDYAFVETTGRIALYDDLRSAPRITEIQPAETAVYIEALASAVYRQSQDAGGTISYTIIREVAENFIHARFKEVVVSILDHGNTIRFADHGPGIPFKEKAQMPGFSSAVEPMKHYIRGVGSGLPIVKEYLELSHGTITIEDNLGTGAVVTISLVNDESFEEDYQYPDAHLTAPVPSVSQPGAPLPSPGVPSVATTASTAIPYPSAAQPMVSAQPIYHPYAPIPQGYPSGSFGYPPMITMPKLKPKEKEFLKLLAVRAPLANKEIQELTDTPPSTTSNTLSNLAKQGLIESMGSQRWLSAYGQQIVSLL